MMLREVCHFQVPTQTRGCNVTQRNHKKHMPVSTTTAMLRGEFSSEQLDKSGLTTAIITNLNMEESEQEA